MPIELTLSAKPFYSYDQILYSLIFLEDPLLMIKLDIPGINSGYHPIQSFNVNAERESLKSLKFKYSHTTSGWVPIFHCVNTQEEILKAVNVEIYLDDLPEEKGKPVGLWITPKTEHLEQHYKLSLDKKNVYKDGMKETPLRESLVKAIANLEAWKKANLTT